MHDETERMNMKVKEGKTKVVFFPGIAANPPIKDGEALTTPISIGPV